VRLVVEEVGFGNAGTWLSEKALVCWPGYSAEWQHVRNRSTCRGLASAKSLRGMVKDA
jgi:hypothetical protein